jgi:hypothetical protein
MISRLVLFVALFASLLPASGCLITYALGEATITRNAQETVDTPHVEDSVSEVDVPGRPAKIGIRLRVSDEHDRWSFHAFPIGSTDPRASVPVVAPIERADLRLDPAPKPTLVEVAIQRAGDRTTAPCLSMVDARTAILLDATRDDARRAVAVRIYPPPAGGRTVAGGTIALEAPDREVLLSWGGDRSGPITRAGRTTMFVLLVPFTAVADVVSFPVQAFMLMTSLGPVH